LLSGETEAARNNWECQQDLEIIGQGEEVERSSGTSTDAIVPCSKGGAYPSEVEHRGALFPGLRFASFVRLFGVEISTRFSFETELIIEIFVFDFIIWNRACSRISFGFLVSVGACQF